MSDYYREFLIFRKAYFMWYRTSLLCPSLSLNCSCGNPYQLEGSTLLAIYLISLQSENVQNAHIPLQTQHILSTTLLHIFSFFFSTLGLCCEIFSKHKLWIFCSPNPWKQYFALPARSLSIFKQEIFLSPLYLFSIL